MRILVFGMSGSKYGGIESFLLQMHKHMDNGLIFDYVIIGDNCIHEEEIKKQGGEIFYLPCIRKHSLAYIRQLKILLTRKKETHAAVYCNLFSTVHVFPAILASKIGYKVILHAHNSNIENPSKLYRFLHNVCRRLWGKMPCLRLCTSDEAAQFIFGTGESRKAEIVFNAIDVERFRFDIEIRNSVRQELSIDEKTVVGFSGRLSSEKNILFLIDIFAEFKKKQNDSVLLIAGEGEQRLTIEKKVRAMGLDDSVLLLGVRKDIERIYQAMDVFVFPSLHEGLGIVLIEAQAEGLPCVCSADVIPSMVCIDDKLLKFVSLNESALTWANIVMEQSLIKQDRADWNKIVFNSEYNIRKEALRLEKMIERYVE